MNLKKKKTIEKYIQNIEKHINKNGVIITTPSKYIQYRLFKKIYAHAYSIKNIYEHENKRGIKKNLFI